MPQLRSEGVRAVSPNGVLDDPSGASPEEGRELLAAAIADLGAFLETRG
jgi:creatinine amidohydrolase